MAASLLRGIRKRGKTPSPWTPPPSPRKSESSNDSRSILLSAIFEMITCPVCTLMILKDEIARCQNDHLVCANCQRSCERCPYCRGAWQGRSRSLENLRSIVLQHEKIPCLNASLGCLEKVYYPQMGIHLGWCQEALVSCPAAFFGACGWMGPIRELVMHVVSQGCATFVRDAKRKVFESGTKIPFDYPKAPPTTPKHFVFHEGLPARAMACLTIVPELNRWTFFFRYLGLTFPGYTFSATCGILLPFSDAVAFSFGGLLHPPNVKMEQVRQSGYYLQLTDKQLAPLLNGSGFLRFTAAFPLDSPDLSGLPPPSHQEEERLPPEARGSRQPSVVDPSVQEIPLPLPVPSS